MKFNSLALSAMLMGSLVALGACETPVPAAIPDLTFAHLEQIRFDAATIEIVDEYRPTLAAPNVEHLFPTSPARAARDWAAARIGAAGSTGSVRVIIQNASVVQIDLPVRKGVEGLFFNEQDVRYEAILEVSIEYRRGLFVTSSVRTEVMRSRTASESISVDERNQLFFKLTEDLLADLDAEMVRNISQYMADGLL
ncbi:MAG: hypothetical protein HOB82_10130 [Alphaproteobacteria bacterium]|jgi:hypothetical protein|nr:hypothetical protein [Alphaproteobacteria bacterium]MBT4711865.1 hypothetical protein [Alphaproteobacteria bacterium]MBT5859599.1 hypothetical protein [Alphaproteobacteria bacterium]